MNCKEQKYGFVSDDNQKQWPRSKSFCRKTLSNIKVASARTTSLFLALPAPLIIQIGVLLKLL